MRVVKQLLQFGVLALNRLQPLRIGDLEAAILGLPVVKSRFADPMLPAHVGRLRPGLERHNADIGARLIQLLQKLSLEA